MTGRLIERYVIRSVIPYMSLAGLLLTAVLLAQQVNRIAEIFGATRSPLRLAAEVLGALLPGLLAFTLPMAVLTGCAIGLSRMGSDSEIVAMRAAGIGRARILAPLLLIGALVAAATLYLGLEATPHAARELKRIAFQAALWRLESPVEPRTFNTEIPGRIIYVRDGNETDGRWGRIFIHSLREDGATLLVTARTGRIDSRNLTSGDGEGRSGAEAAQSVSEGEAELVLSDAAVTTLPATGGANGRTGQIVTEEVSELRMKLDAPNQSLVRRMREREREPEEMRASELIERIRHAPDEGRRRLAAIALHKKLVLGVSPMVFALLGGGIGLRIRRGGRGVGVLLSLLLMVGYYLIFLGGEQAARAGALSPETGLWLATSISVVLGVSLLLLGERKILPRRAAHAAESSSRSPIVTAGGKVPESEQRSARSARPAFLELPVVSGLLDRKLALPLIWNFLLAWSSLVAVFLLFTLFEISRYFGNPAVSANLVARYLFYLVPLIGVALAPVSVLVAVLATYAVMSRRREAVAWWACGQSAYRLALPALCLAACVSLGIWLVAERVVPGTNRRQDALRAQIRGGPAQVTAPQSRQQWVAASDGSRIYSYETGARQNELRNVAVYEFDSEGVHLRGIVAGAEAVIEQNGGGLLVANATVYAATVAAGGGEGSNGGLQRRTGTARLRIVGTEGDRDAFKPLLIKPDHFNMRSLSDYIKTLKRRGETHLTPPLVVALERRRADPLLAPLVMSLLALPLALAFGRRSAVAALCAAVGIGLLFWAATGGAFQMGVRGWLPPVVAAWSPHIVFLALGIYLLARVRT